MDNSQIPETFNSVMGLGAPKEYFKVKEINRIGSLVTSIVLIVGAGIVLLYGVYEAYTWSQQYGPAMIDDKLIGPLVAAGIMLLFGVLMGGSAYANWNRGVMVYERGFAYNDRKGIQMWQWINVVSITAAITRHYHNGIYTGTTHVYTIFNNQNEKLVLNDVFKKVEDLARNIEQGIYPTLYERAAQAYNSGQTLTFGPVAISKGGILIGKKTYPWTEVKQVSVQNGYVKVSKKDGGWFSGASASAAFIPNLKILLSIINQVTGIKAG
jgi:hypothetical protein